MKNCFGNHSYQKASATAGAFLMQLLVSGGLLLADYCSDLMIVWFKKIKEEYERQ
jgi:hypothetical protein